jgi:plasmid stability protein
MIAGMANITIRGLDPQLKARLRVRAAQHGRSMEEEVRAILRAAVAEREVVQRGLASSIHRRFEKLGVELEAPGRDSMRPPPKPR